MDFSRLIGGQTFAPPRARSFHERRAGAVRCPAILAGRYSVAHRGMVSGAARFCTDSAAVFSAVKACAFAEPLASTGIHQLARAYLSLFRVES